MPGRGPGGNPAKLEIGKLATACAKSNEVAERSEGARQSGAGPDEPFVLLF